ncbi:uncharacterized protein PFLUO_LOCUS8477 [Penicillium psychrofluorescens]|uniref:uncharacterized protein n=1 Tax=Penicillium psychrofluorescens TaxID=3158075 RepID=UPI003CCD617C
MADPASAKQIHTQHCRFCNHLLLATTRDISHLPRRAGDAQDKAIIVPMTQTLDPDLDHNDNNTPSGTHTTLLLSTTVPDRRPTLVRREDGIEKRVLLRCGRCRVVVGYQLDRVHYPVNVGTAEGDESNRHPPAVYLLPGAVVETEQMGSGDEDHKEGEWRQWIREGVV